MLLPRGRKKGSSRLFAVIEASASVVTTIIEVAAETPAMNASSATPVLPLCRPMSMPMYSTGAPVPSFIPAHSTGSTGRLSSSRYSGNPQLARVTARVLGFS